MTDAPMLGHPGEEALAAAARGPGSASVRRHLAACVRCREAVALYRGIASAASSRLATGECPPALALVQLAAEPPAARLRSPLQPHLGDCLDCALELEGLERVESAGATLPVLERPAGRLPPLAERLRALLRLEMPLALALEPRRIAGSAVSSEYRQALRDYSARRYRQAVSGLRRAERAGERAPGLALYLGASLLQSGAAEEAVTVLGGVGPRSPVAADARWLLAQALLACGRGKAALAVLQALSRGRSRHRSEALGLAARVSAALGPARGGQR